MTPLEEEDKRRMGNKPVRMSCKRDINIQTCNELEII